jgi:D-3-phosphoglycerate dehydrogenase
MHIVVADELPISAIDVLRAEGWHVDTTAGRSPAGLAAALAEADALIVRSATRVTASLIAGAPRLRVIARAGSGIDNVDVAAAAARQIVVMNAPGATTASVAELAFGLMLSLARHIPAADASMKAAKWEKKRFAGTELGGKTLGVVGFGRIGRAVVRMARAFQMSVVVHDPVATVEDADEADVSLETLDTLCAAADYITLHLPATPKTRHLFDAARLASCKAGVRLVNTSRGGLIDEAALLAALDSGHVAGAGLDVFEQEPPVDPALAKHPSVVATPHVAASTSEAQERVGLESAGQVRDFLKTGAVRHAVVAPSASASA